MGCQGCRGPLLVLLLVAVGQQSMAIQLEGSHISYAKFSAWKPCPNAVNASLSLEFRTDKPTGLLLYSDTGEKSDFIEVKLVAGSMRMTLKTSGHSVVISEGSNLGDGLWHTFKVVKEGSTISITVDTVEQSRKFNVNQMLQSNSSYMYVGGIPINFSAKLSALSLPSVALEPRLRGSVRNLVFSNCGESAQRATMVDNVGVRTNERQSCLVKNLCLNQGVCVSTDTGSICDCSPTEYEGQFCQHAKEQAQATLYGREFFSYHLSTIGEPMISAKDSIQLFFKSRQANGLLFFTGTSSEFVQVSLAEGAVSVVVTLGSGMSEIEVKPRKRFDDNRWHRVLVQRDAREVSVEVDHWRKTGTTTGTFTLLTSDILFLGGSREEGPLQNSLGPNFRGCIREAIYTADNIELDLLNLARNQHDLIEISGKVMFDTCEDLAESQPITFLTEDSYLESVHWDLSKGGLLNLQFRTNEPNGLLLYSLGSADSGIYFAVEILDELLYVTVALSDENIEKTIAYPESVSDGLAHTLSIRINGTQVLIRVNDHRVEYILSGHSSELTLSSPLVFGGVSPSTAGFMPIQMWTAMLRYGYVGCLQDVEVNGLKLALADAARDQSAEGVGEYCRTMPDQCPSYPCMYRGKCREGWNRYVCDCTATGYTGESCTQVALSLGFDGSQFMEIPLPEEASSEVEDISLRFRTERAEGLLFATLSNSSSDRLEVMLDGGQVRMDINLGSGTKSLVAGINLDDNQWHWLQIKRRSHKLELQVDNETTVRDHLDDGRDWVLRRDRIMVASLTTELQPKKDRKEPGFLRSGAKFIDFNRLDTAMVRTKRTRSTRNFIGDMAQFNFNNNDFFDMARSGHIDNLRTNARIDKREALVNAPVTFLSPAAYFTIKLKVYASFTIYFALKTTQPDGVIMYTGSQRGRDFLAIELVNGHLRYIYNVGSGPKVVKSKYKRPLNDNEWHHVTVIRPRLDTHIVKVDDTAAHEEALKEGNNVHFDVDDVFYIGGATKDVYKKLPKQVKSREGFLGCLASLDMDGEQDILGHKASIPDTFKDSVLPGCEGAYATETGPTTECTATSCDNGGLCVQEWNTFTCECDMTSFTGPTCSDDGIAYTFDNGGGLITYTFPEDERPSTGKDTISLGFRTAHENAVLVRINGNTQDYIEMEMVNGNIFVVYNMGSMDHPIGELFMQADDDQYHVVKFTRNGPNATIQVDDRQLQTKTPTGDKMGEFNAQSSIQVGGKKTGGKLQRPFIGTIAGLVINGQHILELAAEGDPAVQIEGDVELEIKPLRPHYSLTPLPPTRPVIITPAPGETNTSDMQSTMGSKTSQDGPGDDIIFSGVESGCHFEDEEECLPGSGSTQDALIRPASEIRSTSPTGREVTPTPKGMDTSDRAPGMESSGDNPCEGDDEDCDSLAGGESGIEPSPSPSRPSTDDIGFHETSSPPTTFKAKKTTTTTTVPTSTSSTPDDIDFPDIPSNDPNEGLIRPSTPATSGGHTPRTRKTSTEDSMFLFVNTTTEAPKPTGKVKPSATNIQEKKDKRKHNSLPMNIGLIIGIAAAVVILFLVLAYALYKYRSRDEGTYKIDETKNYSYETCNTKPPPPVNGERGGSSKQSKGQSSKPRKKDVKEWYV